MKTLFRIPLRRRPVASASNREWRDLGRFGRDLRFSWRSLRRAPGFTSAVVLTLALCLGANLTILSVLYGLILKPLPFREAGQLVEIYNTFPQNNQPKRPTSIPQYLDYKANADLFEGFALWTVWTFNIGEESDPDRGIGARVTADYFQVLGVQPLLGRFYTMEECVPGKDNVLVLTQSFWETRFHSDPNIVGQVIRLSGQPFTIVGVAPRALEACNADTTVIKPFEWQPGQAAPQSRVSQNGTMYARLKPGVDPAAGLAQLTTLEKRFYDQVAPPPLREFLDRGAFKVGLGRVRWEQTKSIRTSLWMLQGGALFVFLLGSVNVANLMLARANARHSEFAVRRALGAGWAALVGQLLGEGLLLSGAGTALGLALTWASLRVINRYTTAIIREVPAITLDRTVLVVTLAVMLGVALFIALLPVLNAGRSSLVASMRGGTRGGSAGRGLRATSGMLVIAQVALALMLLVGASLLIRSFAQVLAVNPGFDARHVIQGRIAFGVSVSNPESAQSLQALILARMGAIPGVDKIGATSSFALNGRFPIVSLPVRGSNLGPDETFPTASLIIATPDYFDVVGTRLLEGRLFNADDLRPKARQVFVVDQDFARKYFPGRSPVGEVFDFRNPNLPPEQWPMIIGVVSVAKLNGTEDRSGVPFAYVPMRPGAAMSVVVRTTRPPAAIIAQMRQTLRSIDSSLPLYNVGTLQEGLDGMLANRRGVMALLAAFAAIALLLSAVGIYGMLAYDVSQRTREIGIRGAIGATREQIVGMILRQGLWKAGVGLGLGLGGAICLTRFMRGLLFEVTPADPISYIAVSALLLAVAILASWIPARRASRVDPVIALRAE